MVVCLSMISCDENDLFPSFSSYCLQTQRRVGMTKGKYAAYAMHAKWTLFLCRVTTSRVCVVSRDIYWTTSVAFSAMPPYLSCVPCQMCSPLRENSLPPMQQSQMVVCSPKTSLLDGEPPEKTPACGVRVSFEGPGVSIDFRGPGASNHRSIHLERGSDPFSILGDLGWGIFGFWCCLW